MALADADTITLDPPAVAVNRARLALSGALTFGLIDVMEADYGNAEVEQFLSARRYGEIPVGHRLPNRTVEYGLRFQAVSGAGVSVGIRAVQRKVATFQAEGGWLGRTLAPRTAGEWGTDVLYADVVDASLSLPSDWMAQRQEVYLDARLTLTVLPDFYGAEVAAGSANSSGENDSVSLLGTIGGDYPARSRYTVTDTGSLTRKTVWIGSQAATYGTAATEALDYQAEALTPLDQASATAVSGAHGGTAVRNASVGAGWTGLVSTQILTSGHMSHWGNYRLLARCSSSAEAEIRVEYSVGDALARRKNSPAVIPAGTSAFYLRDLGEIRIPRAPVGSQRWEGRISARATGGSASVDVDKIYLLPMESLSITSQRSDPSYFYTPDSYLGRDSFADSSGTVEASSLDVGGTWAKAGAGASWKYTGDGRAAGGTASGAIYYRASSAGSASDSYVEARFSFSLIPTGSTDDAVGLLTRYAGTTNFAAAYLNPNPEGTDPADGSEAIVGFVAGSAGRTASFPITAGREYSLATAVTSNGVYRVWAWEEGRERPTSPLVVGYASALATGGSAASGSVGFYSSGNFNAGLSSGSATIDDWYAYVPNADAAVLSGRALSARHDGAWRQAAGADVYAPALVTGNYPRDPVAGIEGRVTRTLVVASAGDLDDEPDLTPTAWNVTRHYRPTYLFVPEA